MIKTNRVKINNNVAVNVNTQSPGEGTLYQTEIYKFLR